MDQGPNPELELTHSERVPLIGAGLNPAEWFTTRTLAAYWGIKTTTVKMAAFQGRIPSVKHGIRRYYNKSIALIAWHPTPVQKRNEQGVANRPLGRGIELLAKVEEKYLVALADAVTLADWATIIEKTVVQAKTGDWRARKFLADYLLGTPVHRVIADVEVDSKGAYSDDQRAAAVTALLKLVRSRTEGEVIDVDGTPVGSSVAIGESSG